MSTFRTILLLSIFCLNPAFSQEDSRTQEEPTSKKEENQEVVEEISVFPSTFSINRRDPQAKQFLGREEIQLMPHIGDDLYRTVASLPGTGGDDISAKFTVRGGSYEEVLVLLDGMEIYEPFHLKDFSGIFSIVDAEAMGGLDLMTGGFSAVYGNRSSGVLSMNTVSPVDRRTSINVSMSNTGLVSEGTFADGLGQYLISARRGYLDILLDLAGEAEDDDLSPSYQDSLAKIQYAFTPDQVFSFHYLYGKDKLTFKEVEDGEEAHTNYGSYYLWANLQSQWGSSLQSDTIVFFGNLDRDRRASEVNDTIVLNIADVRDFSYYGIKQDWQFHAGDRLFMQWGLNLKKVSSDYDYHSFVNDSEALIRPPVRQVDHNLKPSGEEYGVYLTTRYQFNPALIAELGLRYDHQTINKESQLSPRLNLAYKPAHNTTLRLAAGRYYQAQGLHELQVEDDVTEFYQPQSADHFLLGIEREFSPNTSLRIEAYHKRLNDLHLRFENMFDTLEALPEIEDDRIAVAAEKGKASGVEVVYKHRGEKFSWLAHYTYAKVEEEVGGRTQPRRWDQRHAAGINLSWRHNVRWTSNFAWVFHSGWRTTDFHLETLDEDPGYQLVMGNTYEAAFPAYHRLDFRLNYHAFSTGTRGFVFYLDISNVYDRENVRGYPDIYVTENNGQPQLNVEEEYWLPRLPSLGLSWKF